MRLLPPTLFHSYLPLSANPVRGAIMASAGGDTISLRPMSLRPGGAKNPFAGFAKGAGVGLKLNVSMADGWREGDCWSVRRTASCSAAPMAVRPAAHGLGPWPARRVPPHPPRLPPRPFADAAGHVCSREAQAPRRGHQVQPGLPHELCSGGFGGGKGVEGLADPRPPASPSAGRARCACDVACIAPCPSPHASALTFRPPLP